MTDNGRNHLGTVIWKHHRIDPDAPMESSLRSYEILPPRNDSLHNKTRGSRTLIPLNTTIRAPRPTAQKPRILLLLPDWETGHLDLTPQSKRHLLEEHTIDQEHSNPEENRTSTWSHDGGEALGRLGNQIIGGHRLTNPANSIPPKRLRFTIIDHCMNLHTPCFTNMQTLPHRLCILGNPCSKTIDLQIPTQQGQTCMDAILLTLQIVGCQKERIHKESEGIQAFTPDRITKGGLRYPGPTRSNSTGLLNLPHQSTLANRMGD